jgi:hypothetical protein
VAAPWAGPRGRERKGNQARPNREKEKSSWAAQAEKEKGKGFPFYFPFSFSNFPNTFSNQISSRICIPFQVGQNHTPR